MQDGHSVTEQLVYDLMWRTGRQLDPDIRHFQLPLEALAWKVKIAERNLRPLLQRLAQKRSILKIAEPDRGRKIPAAYHVYSFRKILALRKEAGLEYVVRSKGVEFISRDEALALEAERAAALERMFQAPDEQSVITSPDTSSPVARTPDPPTILESKTSGYATSPQTAQTSPDVRRKTSPDDTSPLTLLGHYSSGQSSAAAPWLPPQLPRAIREITGPAFTDAAAGRLWRECRRRTGDCTAAEVLHFVTVKWEAIRRAAGVTNPVGLLLTSVPEFFEGDTLAEHRNRQGREEEEARRLRDENRLYYQEILADASATEDERAWARTMLDALGVENG